LSDEPPGTGPPEDAEAPEESPPPEPPPATWAGRQAAAREAGDEPSADSSAPQEGDAKSPPATELAAEEPEEPTPEEPPADESPPQEPAPQAAPEEPASAGDGRQQDTTEADTALLADREAAEEAALAGVRARAAQEAARRQRGQGPPTMEAPATPAGGIPVPAAPATEAPAAPVEATTGVADEEADKPRLWIRFLAASVVIVVSMASATAVSLLVVLTDIAKGLGGLGEGVTSQLATVEGGAPRTILILGSDKRTDEGGKGRSDTTILMRLDADRDLITLLSIPRDLKVNIPGLGPDKLNAAYSYGGPKLTLEVLKQLTGLDIHHVVNVDFLGFAETVNAIDCVYIDVDRRYFVPPESGFAEIDIEAGYQRLCGLKALQYVRFRHDDNDLVRAARQQDFLREARQKLPASRLWSERKDLIDIAEKYTTSDIDDVGDLISVIKLLVDAGTAPVREIHFPAELGGPDSAYVTHSEPRLRVAIRQFLGVERPPEPAPTPEGRQRPGGGGDGGDGGDGAQDREREPAEQPDEPAGPAMIDSTASAQQYAELVYDHEFTPYGVHYPTRLVPNSTISDASRSFKIDGPGNDLYFGYKLVVSIQRQEAFTEYYGVSGTDWKDPPILENPDVTREIDGRNYLLFHDGGRLRLVGWKTDDGAYWVQNTLLQTLSEDEMLSIATSTRELEKPVPRRKRQR
jgi:polyisoprenyl-teichoic acid--peptidoglycan teichoic acid transferase